MKAMSSLKKVVVSLVVFALLLTNVVIVRAEINPEHAIIGNNDPETAYNIGNWKYKSIKTCAIEENQSEAWFRFSMSEDEQIYVTCSRENIPNGMTFSIYNANNMDELWSASEIADPSSFIKFLAVKANGSQSTSYLLRVDRGNYVGDMFFSLSFGNRMKKAIKTFDFRGTARNNGNKSMSFAGVDSTVITADLSRESSIPNGAIVNKVDTSSYMSPNQGNVRHMLMCQTESAWWTSKVSSANSGSYYISSSNKIPVKQIWSFKYNAKAGAKSSMNSVKLRVDYSYDITSGWNFR
jgi:uncharacterized protein ybdN